MKQYHDLLRHVLDNGDAHQDRTGVGTTSVFGYQFRHDLRTGFPLLTTKRMFTRGIIEELRWFLAGKTDNKTLSDLDVHIWDAWATPEQCARFGREAGDLGPIYGKQWRDFGGNGEAKGVDQIKNLIDDLLKTPNSRRLIVTGWNPQEATKVALPPCHTLFQCKVTEKEETYQDVAEMKSHMVKYLDLQLYQRSADSFLGVPFNIASYALLLELIAHVTNMVPRNFIHTFGDLHIYNNHREQVETQLKRTPYQLPRLVLNERLRGRGFEGLLDFKTEDAQILGYQCHPAIKADVAV